MHFIKFSYETGAPKGQASLERKDPIKEPRDPALPLTC